jgi:hypothetical protein
MPAAFRDAVTIHPGVRVSPIYGSIPSLLCPTRRPHNWENMVPIHLEGSTASIIIPSSVYFHLKGLGVRVQEK